MNLVAMLVILALPFTAFANDPKPNTLTEKEIADGWILLFDGKSTFGWTSPNESRWTIKDGMMAPQKDKEGILVSTTAFGDYELIVDFEKAEKTRPAIQLHCNSEGSGGLVSALAPYQDHRKGRWQTSAVVEKGVVKSISSEEHGGKNKEVVPIPKDLKPLPETGHISLFGSHFIVHSVKLRPRSLSQLFNGKDLDGWKIYDGDKTRIKSKFAATKEGWLSLKDGPGDLQTTKEWADFVLQLECKSNGKHLNSGIFFRCLPAQYQMGYEAQIHNGFGDDKEYTLDVFDPKTNKPLDKKKEKYSALDFGTGAIYRRQPARFQVSKDNEWFTMTVVAQGRHFATWVNGIQQVDWTDHRPLGDNARVGAYLKKGPISIQGHDPTTDLHFRNLRITELPSK